MYEHSYNTISINTIYNYPLLSSTITTYPVADAIVKQINIIISQN